MSNQYQNIVSAQSANEKAMERAKSALTAKGVHYPCYDPNLSTEENHERLMAYSAQESALIVQFLKMPSGPRPLEPLPASEKNFNQWGRPYYER